VSSQPPRTLNLPSAVASAAAAKKANSTLIRHPVHKPCRPQRRRTTRPACPNPTRARRGASILCRCAFSVRVPTSPAGLGGICAVQRPAAASVASASASRGRPPPRARPSLARRQHVALRYLYKLTLLKRFFSIRDGGMRTRGGHFSPCALGAGTRRTLRLG
jgi:hypothetical protein